MLRRVLGALGLIAVGYILAEAALAAVSSVRAERRQPSAWAAEERFWTVLGEMQASARAMGFR